MSQPIEPKDVHVPRTDAETDSSTLDVVRVAIRRQARQAAIGFGILVAAVAYVAGGISQTGCEGRQNTAETLSGIIERLDEANAASYAKGKITTAERAEAHAVYSAETKRLVVPECKSVLPF